MRNDDPLIFKAPPATHEKIRAARKSVKHFLFVAMAMFFGLWLCHWLFSRSNLSGEMPTLAQDLFPMAAVLCGFMALAIGLNLLTEKHRCLTQSPLEAELTREALILRFTVKTRTMPYENLDVRRLVVLDAKQSLLCIAIKTTKKDGAAIGCGDLEDFALFVAELRRRVAAAGGLAGGVEADRKTAEVEKRREIRRGLGGSVIVLAIFLLYAWPEFAEYREERRIRETGAVATARIISLVERHEDAVRVEYVFADGNGSTWQRESGWLSEKPYGTLRPADTLTIRYLPTAPDKSRIPEERMDMLLILVGAKALLVAVALLWFIYCLWRFVRYRGARESNADG